MKINDVVTRILGGTIAMKMVITKIDEDLITCRAAEAADMDIEWTFDPRTGVEIDEDLGWGPQTGITGSYLEEINKRNKEAH